MFGADSAREFTQLIHFTRAEDQPRARRKLHGL
jgi:hypothetical protein